MVAMKGVCKNRHTASTEGVGLHAPQEVDLGGGGSSSLHDVTQQDGLSPNANCKMTLENLPRFLMHRIKSMYLT